MDLLVSLNVIYALFITLIIGIGSVFTVFNENEKQKFFLFIYICIILYVAFIIRNRGWDYVNYLEIYEEVKPINDLSFAGFWQEPGFIIYYSLCKTLNFPGEAAIALLSIISFTILINSILKYNKDYLLVIFVFYFFYFYRELYGHIRQGFALAMAIYSFRYIEDKKIIRFLIINLIGLSFHVTALAFFPAYFIARTRINKIGLSIILISGMVFAVYSNSILNLLVSFDIPFLGKLKSYFLSRPIKFIMVPVELLKGITFSVLFILNRDRLIKQNINNKKFINLYIFGIVLYMILLINVQIASRVARTYLIFDIFLLSQYLRLQDEDNSRYGKYILILIISTYTLVRELYMMLTQNISYFY